MNEGASFHLCIFVFHLFLNEFLRILVGADLSGSSWNMEGTTVELNRRTFLKGAMGGLLAMSNVTRATSASAPASQPNLVFVFPDQMRGQAMGFLNEDPVITPHLDAFAQESIVLSDAVSNYPVCSPYRAMLMTGKYAHTCGVPSNCNSQSAPHGCELRASDRCWSDVLKDSGYSLGYIGKWHLDAPYEPYVDCANNRGKMAWNEWCPPERRHGFDFWYSYGTYDWHLKPMYWSNDASRDEFHYVDQWGPEHEADLATRYIHNEGGEYRDPNQPFALVVGMNPPHTPYRQVPEKYVERYADRTIEELCNRPNIPPADTKWGKQYRSDIRHYFAMVTGVDEQFGRILTALDEAGLRENTIVVFTSDHGNCLGVHNQGTKNVHYEESMRIPFLIRWPGQIAPRQDDLLLSTPDLYPTLLGLMGFGDAVPQDVEGKNHAPLFLEGKGERPTSQLYIWVPVGQPANGRRGIRTHQYTLLLSKNKEGNISTLLHDNVNDPYQLSDVSEERPDAVTQLTEELNNWLQYTSDPWLHA